MQNAVYKHIRFGEDIKNVERLGIYIRFQNDYNYSQFVREFYPLLISFRGNTTIIAYDNTVFHRAPDGFVYDIGKVKGEELFVFYDTERNNATFNLGDDNFIVLTTSYMTPKEPEIQILENDNIFQIKQIKYTVDQALRAHTHKELFEGHAKI